MAPDFLNLVFGAQHPAGSFASVCVHLRQSLSNVLDEIVLLPNEPENRVSLFGPLLGRSVLELTFTSLVARIDPFRVLALREIQMHASSAGSQYLGERTSAAIQWTGDVRPNKAAPQELWKADRQFGDYSRALFGSHYEEVFWKPAFIATVDGLLDSHQGVWFDELRSMQPEAFVGRTRSECDSAYSALSKGIHQEFVIPQTSTYDKPAVIVYVKDSLRLAARVALVTNAISTSVGCLPLTDALNHFATAQQFESIQ